MTKALSSCHWTWQMIRYWKVRVLLMQSPHEQIPREDWTQLEETNHKCFSTHLKKAQGPWPRQFYWTLSARANFLSALPIFAASPTWSKFSLASYCLLPFKLSFWRGGNLNRLIPDREEVLPLISEPVTVHGTKASFNTCCLSLLDSSEPDSSLATD